MLEIKIEAKEGWDPNANDGNGGLINTKPMVLCLEHSLVSLSKWEAKFKKPYLSDTEKTDEEIMYYIKCMTITQNVDPAVYKLLNKNDLKAINDYVMDSMTATWFSDNRKKVEGQPPTPQSKEIITSELIYYWMISYQIPFECQKWHLNRLLTLIRICNVKEKQANGKNGKMSKRDILSQNRALNAARRQRLGTKG